MSILNLQYEKVTICHFFIRKSKIHIFFIQSYVSFCYWKPRSVEVKDSTMPRQISGQYGHSSAFTAHQHNGQVPASAIARRSCQTAGSEISGKLIAKEALFHRQDCHSSFKYDQQCVFSPGEEKIPGLTLSFCQVH